MIPGPVLTRRSLVAATVATAAAGVFAQGFTGARDVRRFGARGDGVADDRDAIQRAIDDAHATGGGVVAFPRGTYRVTHRTSPDGDGLASIILRSGVTLLGASPEQSIIRLADAQLGPGSFARMVSSTGGIERAVIRNLGFDGNRAGQGSEREAVNGAIIQLGWKGRCTDVTIDGNALRGANGQAIQCVGSADGVSRNVRITRNDIRDCTYIGIQASQFEGLLIESNVVTDTADNGIDLYGDNPDGSTVSTSGSADILGNYLTRCQIGIFLETVARIHVAGNHIVDAGDAGLRINRIHGEPRDILIEQNSIKGGQRGMSMGGDTGGVTIRDNDVIGFTVAGLAFEYNVSNVTATRNRFTPAAKDTPIILGMPTANSGRNGQPPEQLSRIVIRNNSITGRHDATRRFVSGYQRMFDVVVDGFDTSGQTRIVPD